MLKTNLPQVSWTYHMFAKLNTQTREQKKKVEEGKEE